MNYWQYIKTILLSIVCAILLSACSQQQQLKHKVHQLIKQTPGHPDVGIVIQSMQDGKILYHQNAHRHYTPASTLKTFTATAALLFLGPDFQYHTQIFSTSRIDHGVINGNVNIIFSGDPTLTKQNLTALIQALHQYGITKINGNVYLDNQAFDQVKAGPGWMWDDMNFCWSAPATAIMLDHNCFQFYLKPAKHSGEKPHMLFPRILHYISIQNDAVTKLADNHSCELSLKANTHNHYILSGCIAPDSRTLTMDVAIHNPTNYAAKLTAHLFKRANIQLDGNIIAGRTAHNNYLLVEHKSKPLRLIIDKMLKNSDDLIADALARKIGAIYFMQQGNWKNATAAMLSILQDKVGINPDNMTLVDGSGISRYNLVTPSQVAQVLNYSYHNFAISPEFISSLPIAGVDGTLHKHHYTNHPGIYAINPDIVGKLRAKTGTMTGVVGLAGYLQTKQGHMISIVILVNNFKGKVYPYRLLANKIAEYAADNL